MWRENRKGGGKGKHKLTRLLQIKRGKGERARSKGQQEGISSLGRIWERGTGRGEGAKEGGMAGGSGKKQHEHQSPVDTLFPE